MQILLEEDQKKALEQEAYRRKTSVGSLIREAVSEYRKLSGERESILGNDDPIWNIVGMAHSSEKDLSENHDFYLYGRKKKRVK